MGLQARTLGFALLAAAAITAVAAWQATRSDERESRPVLAPEGATDARRTPTPEGRSPAEPGRVAVPTAGQSGGDPAALAAGRVRGRIEVARGAPLPAQFELLVEAEASGDPAAAPAKVYVFRGEERLVTLDLPPGRSILSARAEGLASRRLTLERPEDGAMAPFELLLEPAGRLGGQVVDVRGAPLADLPVHLLSAVAAESRAVRSDAEGRYAFADLPVGAYRVAFGSIESPVAPVVPAEVVRDEVRDVPPQTMPEFGEAEIAVQDAEGSPIAGARVTGRGQRGGAFDGVTDAQGRLRARFLPAGPLYVDVSGPQGPRASEVLEVQPGRIANARLTVRGK